MYTSLGISADQVYGDMYTAWLRDTHEKNTPEVKRLYTTTIENGFHDHQILLRRQRLGANFIGSLAPLLHQCAVVKLDLHGNMLRDVGCNLIVHVLHDLPQLTYLDLGANAIGCSSVLASGIKNMKGGGASAVGGTPAPRMGGAGAGGGTRINTTYINAMQGLGEAIAQHKRLAVLILGSEREEAYTNQIDVTGAMLVLEGCLLNRTLKRLDLSGNPFAMSADVSSAGAASKYSTSTSDIAAIANSTGGSANEADGAATKGSVAYGMRSSPRTPVQLLAQLLRTSVTLTHLTLRSVGLTDSGATFIFDAAGTSRVLQHLNLSSNGLSSHVADMVGFLLQQRTAAVRGGALGCTLQSLVLADNDLWDNATAEEQAHRGGFGISTPTVAGQVSQGSGRLDDRAQPSAATIASSSLSKFVGRTRALRDSVMSDTSDALPSDLVSPINKPPAPGLTLLTSLNHDQFITTLILDDCAMDDTALYTLCRSLMTNTMLKVLSMRRNRLSAAGVTQLGRALCRHPCLEKLLVSGNVIEDEGACALAAAINQPNASLTELDVAKAWLGDRGLIAIGVALQMNTSLRVLHISDNHFTYNGGASFAALLDSNTHVVRCELGATSVSHHILLRVERTTARNRTRAENEDADALKTEVVRLHYQKYKLLEAHLELEGLRENNADVKRTTENFDLQTKQDHGDLVKRIRELEEQIENTKQQAVRYTEQKAKLETELAKAEQTHEEEMGYLSERLVIEVGLREKAEAEFQERQEALKDWKENGPARELQKEERLEALKADREAWTSQRKAYRSRVAEVQHQLAALEAAAASALSKKSSKKGRQSPKA